jgi:long-subunit acyl-CoA synthetase (AMP-forming)/GNAT superfamily N-acetyltransferase
MWSIRRKGERPTVLLWGENVVDVALCDLACLQFDIVVAPVTTTIEQEDLQWIVRRIQPDLCIADSPQRRHRLRQLEGSGRVLAIGESLSADEPASDSLSELAAEMGRVDVDRILDDRPRLEMDDVCTVMFTSGSTGRPKGVVFSQANLVTKRYCRAAALPSVGEGERLLCYLPLFHTFGRYLEMLGTIFWRGTYVFAQNPSLETLLEGMRRVQPTGLISIPRRWQQIRETALAQGADVRDLTGGQLRWGLSAAGHLEPRVFRFFHRNGVDLCSGFGMTEATGGITMSPPGRYIDETVGRALPGIDTHFSERGEMFIRGPYVARYLAEAGSGITTEPTLEIDGEDGWMPTGDIFRHLEDEQVQIVDRVKDIYKNSRGQTIAPRRVEDLFEGVAGIRRVYLVGDHRPHNVLLVAPDVEDAVFRDAPDELSRHAYVASVVAAANARLLPFERVVDFAFLDRNFEAERGELTPKGTFRRRQVEANFADTIDRLYHHPTVEVEVDGLTVTLQPWLVRDLGGLAEDFVARGKGLLDRRRDRLLRIWRVGSDRVTVGDLVYGLEGDQIDLGLLVRQPSLWMGNPSLIWFGGGKDGWDVGYGSFSRRVWLPEHLEQREDFRAITPSVDGDPLLVRVDAHLQKVLHWPARRAVEELESLGSILESCEPRLDRAARRRLDALADHPDEPVRCAAFRVLLLEKPAEGYTEAFGTFLESGRSFLTRESIHQISTLRFGRRHLELLRQRMAEYRAQNRWPVSDAVRSQLAQVFDLLEDFAREQPDHYHAIRCELANWVLLDRDRELARAANRRLQSMVAEYEQTVEERRVPIETGQVVFDEGMRPERRDQLMRILTESGFLSQAVELAFAEIRFDPRKIVERGLWITRVHQTPDALFYRWSIHTTDGRHRQLMVALREDLETPRAWESICWLLAIAGYPFAERVLPRFGCARPELGAVAMEWVDDLTVHERIREATARMRDAGDTFSPEWCRALYVRAMAAALNLWKHSGRRLLPGDCSPDNLTVPAIDFRSTARVLTLGPWRRGDSPAPMLVSMHHEFFEKVSAQSPDFGEHLDPTWIPEAVVESLGAVEGREILSEMSEHAELGPVIRSYLDRMGPEHHVPLKIESAVQRFRRWEWANPEATPSARLEEVEELVDLYHLQTIGEYWRHELFRRTLFASAPGLVQDAFDELLAASKANPEASPSSLVELSHLQSLIDDPGLRIALSRLVYPRSGVEEDLDVVAWGEPGHEQVTLRTWIQDRGGVRYEVREPVSPEEIGQVYRLFYRDHYARPVSEADRFLLALDEDERVVGALIWRANRPGVVHMDGFVVRAPLSNRGIGSALLEDFCTRCEGRGIEVVRTNFVMRRFCERRGFHVDRRWGGLVRFLQETEGVPA